MDRTVRCYRIGGDESRDHPENKTAEETEEIIRQVRAEIEFANEQSDIPISVAMDMSGRMREEKNLQRIRFIVLMRRCIRTKSR